MDKAPVLTVEQQDGRSVLFLSGDWTLARHADFPRLPEGQLRDAILLDGTGLTALDTSGAHHVLNLLDRAGTDKSAIELRTFAPAAQQVFTLVRQYFRHEEEAPPPPLPGMLYQLGFGAVRGWWHLTGVAAFIGRVASEWFQQIRRPHVFRMREFVAQLEAVFVYAIPITMAMIFLLGVVFAYLMGVQAQKFGANIFVVDGVSAAVLREISPVIVAILVAGRSGAAMTAQLGAMKVNEEVDALTVLGLSPYGVLVLPRILALFLAMPLLVFLGDVAGLLGGMLVAKSQLGIEYSQFWDRLDSVLKMKTLLIGLAKAPVFALFIGFIACRMGLSVSRDARSVGEHTTSTVVQSIVAVIIINAIFAVAFSNVGI